MEFIYVIINSTDNNLIFLVSILGICIKEVIKSKLEIELNNILDLFTIKNN